MDARAGTSLCFFPDKSVCIFALVLDRAIGRSGCCKLQSCIRIDLDRITGVTLPDALKGFSVELHWTAFFPFSRSTLDPRLRALGSNLEKYMIRQLALDSATALQKPCPPRFRNWPSGSTTALQQLPKDAHGLVRFGSRAPKSKT